MCGIFGTAGFSDKTLLKRMGRLIRYRGPDDQGYFTDTGIGLGMRRLSIIDLKGGRQPVHNEDSDIWCVFNGEIYNYKELRAALPKHRFYTESDTESIVHSYEEYGLRFPEKLNGMFAIALWDSRKKILILARDRVGKKPLYYTMIGKSILFASEIKALLLHEGVRREVNQKVLHNYLTLRYCPGNETMFKGIYKLLPGHLLTYRKGSVAIRKYWSLDVTPRQHDSSVKALRELLEDSVKSRLISDVPIGVYLSGGLDSTAIVGLMKKAGAEKINTFSIGFGIESDETGLAKNISEFYGTNHREFTVDSGGIHKVLPETVWHMDEPLADVTNIPTYLISGLARKHVKVVLTGEGSDELFSGYAHEKGMLKTRRMRHALSLARKLGAIDAVKKMPLSFLDKFFEYPGSMGNKGRERMVEYLKSSREHEMYSTLVAAFDEKEKEDLCKIRGFEPTKDLFKPFFSVKTSLANKMLLADVAMWLPNYILPRLDKMTMANSVEGRAPFMDYRLLELSVRIPQDMKLKGNMEKYILRKAVADIVPKDVLKRKKRTFITPIHMWGEKSLMDMCSILHESEFFRKDYVYKIIEDYRNSKLIRERQLWTLITFELWHRTFIQKKGLKPLHIF